MKAEIITIGGEILSGRNVDTNGPFIGRQCEKLGISVAYKTTVADIEADIAAVLQIAMKRCDIVFTTGGLGATSDDITKRILAKTLQLELEIDPEVLQWIEAYFKKKNRKVCSKQLETFSFIPRGATVLKNRVGIAPAMMIEYENTLIISLPGPPQELESLVTEKVTPFLMDKYRPCLQSIKVKDIWCFGAGEKTLENMMLESMTFPTNPSIAFLPYGPLVNLRITAKGEYEGGVQERLTLWTEKIKRSLGPYVFGEDKDTLSKVVGDMLKIKKLKIAVAEAGSDGLLASVLTDVPGSSAYFMGGIVGYSNDVKQSCLAVSNKILVEEGAVSAACAKAMARGVADVMKSDLAVAITSISGPGGSTFEKPVGLTYIALIHGKDVICKEFKLFGDRLQIKNDAKQYALNMLRLYLKEK